MSGARDRWLDAGVTVLTENGAAGVRIDRLAARLGLSKGSFHHHFDGADGYRRELLAHVEDLLLAPLRVAVPAGAADARATLAGLTALVDADGGPYRPRLEVALRAWATSDPDAAEVQARVDAARLAVLQSIWRPVSTSDDEARVAALLPHLIAVGASVVVPPIDPDELRRVYQLLLPLVPGVPPHPPHG